MIISPPLLKAKDATETDATWIERVMTVAERRGFPTNAHGSWHGGIHIRHTDGGRPVESVRAISPVFACACSRSPAPLTRRR